MLEILGHLPYTLKVKKFALLGSKFFPFIVDPFSEVSRPAEKQVESHKSCFSCKSQPRDPIPFSTKRLTLCMLGNFSCFLSSVFFLFFLN